MSAYRLLLGLLALALVVAFATWAIGSDPGYVLVQRGDWALETSLVFAVIAVLGAGFAIWGLVWLLRWPLTAVAARNRRRNRLQFQRGTVALAEGRPQRAEKLLVASSRLASLRLPALIGAYRAAHQRGDAERREELLGRIGDHADGAQIADVLRAEAALAAGQPDVAIDLLAPLETAQKLPPSGLAALADALAARGRARDALAYLPRVRRAHVFGAAEHERFESRIRARALADARNATELVALWDELNRSQRRDAAIATAYARRAATLNLGDAAARDVENVLKKAWSDELAVAWATMPCENRTARLRAAEGFLKEHGHSPALLVALGRLCREQSLWGKAEDSLRRALAAGAGPAAWEELGHSYAAQGDAERASRAYANALAVARGESPAALGAKQTREDVLAPLAIAEERDAHGVPRLPGPR